MGVLTPTVSNFRTSFPELPASEVDDDIVEAALDAAIQFHDQTTRGVLLCAAHLATDTGLVEILRSTQGPVSAQFKEFDGGTFWATTSYGREFRELEKRMPPVILVV